jgi:hypothetical protein
MARLDYRIDEKNINPSKFIRALVTLFVQQINTLRAFHGLPAITRAQAIAAIKAEIRNLT